MGGSSTASPPRLARPDRCCQASGPWLWARPCWCAVAGRGAGRGQVETCLVSARYMLSICVTYMLLLNNIDISYNNIVQYYTIYYNIIQYVWYECNYFELCHYCVPATFMTSVDFQDFVRNRPVCHDVPRLGQLIVAWDLPRWAQSFALFFKGVEEGPWQPWQSGVETFLVTCRAYQNLIGERQPWSTLGVFGCWSCAKKCGASNNTMSSMSSELSIGSALFQGRNLPVAPVAPPGLPHMLQCDPTHHADDPKKGRREGAGARPVTAVRVLFLNRCTDVLTCWEDWTDEVLRKKNMLFPTNTYQGPTTPCHVFDCFCTLWSLESLS